MKTVWILAALAIAFWLLSRRSEGWRPFAWYGYKVGEYQPGGDWSCVVSPSNDAYVPTPVLPTTAWCDRVYHKEFPKPSPLCKRKK